MSDKTIELISSLYNDVKERDVIIAHNRLTITSTIHALNQLCKMIQDDLDLDKDTFSSYIRILQTNITHLQSAVCYIYSQEELTPR